MDLSFSKEDLAFRDEVRRFIDEAYTPELRTKNTRSKNGYLDKEGMVQWQQALYRKGWAAPHWPVEYGGPGFTATQKYIFDLEMSAAGVPTSSPMGLRMVAPVIMAFGTPEQKKKHLPPILASEVWWCQGYSEPGSGSDLASLQMKCEDKGDHYLLNGSKIWTTHAQWADWMFNLVRTSNAGKPQEGITFLLVDMKTPGISVEPLVTLDLPVANQQEINQVFYTDVKVPKENRIGEENKGWTYAKYLLEFERGNAYGPGLKRAIAKVRKMASATDASGARLIDDSSFRARLDSLEIEVTSMEFFELRMFSAMSAGQRPGAESSMLKCKGTDLQQAISELSVETLGYYCMPFVRDTFANTNEPSIGPDFAAPVTPYYFNLRKASIYAGSNEIQHNIMAKAVLGL
ncbi:MAG: pimeloyl-CoA dehydrogenase large subunit [Alphaproteobacteria bacterium]|nr:pimeloyl-CoA dehydrogenase large subunit [Alphaproteobacteria bacterium]